MISATISNTPVMTTFFIGLMSKLQKKLIKPKAKILAILLPITLPSTNSLFLNFNIATRDVTISGAEVHRAKNIAPV